MKTHITTLNNMAGTASLAHRRVLKVAQSIGCHEMGLSFYPLKPDYAKEIDKRLDGIIAPLNYGDIVIFQYPSWIGVNYDESFVNKIKSYRDTKLIIFVQDIQKLMFDSEQAILDMEIRTLNKADLLILPSKKMHRYLKENGLDEKPVIYQTIWDMPSDICFVDHAVTRCFHFAGNYNRFPFLAEYHGNQTCPDYDVVPDAKSGKAGEPVEMRFTKAEYDSLEAVIEEVFASYVNLTRQGDSFFVAMHPLHISVAEHVLKGKRVIATFFENRFDFTQTTQAADFLEHAENIITDSDYTTKLIMANLGAVNNKPFRLHITDIPPYDARMDFGISSQLRVQNILVPVDGLTEDAFAQIIKGLADYLTINDLARVHFFTRDASWGHEDAIKNDTVKLLDSMGYDSRLVTGDGEAALGFGGSGADAFGENELEDMEKPVEQRFFVDVCVDERDISKCINEQRVILDMRGTMDVFVYVTAISKGVPRISLSADQFLISGKNGMVIDDFSDIGRSLTYYLDSFENWNQALVECYELGQKYTTSVLLKKWRKVLNFSE